MKDDKKWKILKSEYIVRRPWLTARKDCIKMPDGNIHDEFYVLEYPDWVNVIAITTSGKFVMERQYRHGLQWTGYEICAGVCEAGEEPMEAAKRELFEETGYGGGTWTPFMTLSPNTSTVTNLSHTFLAIGVEPVGEQHLEKTEDISVHLMTKEEVFSLLANNEIKQALMAAPLWKYFFDRKE